MNESKFSEINIKILFTFRHLQIFKFNLHMSIDLLKILYNFFPKFHLYHMMNQKLAKICSSQTHYHKQNRNMILSIHFFIKAET
jgi:hypothetical protein